MSLRGGIFNCRAGRNPDVVRAAVAGIFDRHRLDFLLLQEANRYVDSLSLIPGWRVVASDVCGTAVMVRKGVESKFEHVALIGRLPWFYRRGMHPRRAIASAVIGGWLRVASVHMVPAPENFAPRARAYVNGCERIVTWANDRPRIPLVIAGDWNKPGRAEGPDTPWDVAKRIGGYHAHIPGRVLYPIARGCRIGDLEPFDEGGSDHELVLFTVHRTERKAAA